MINRPSLTAYRAARRNGNSRHDAYALAKRAASPLGRMGDHAPIPWRVVAQARPDKDGFADVPVTIADARGYIVAAVSNDAPADEANATAARIVECVNALAGQYDARGYIAWLERCRDTLDKLAKPEN